MYKVKLSEGVKSGETGRIRRRRVKFGNPALGTYGGVVWTVDDDDDDDDDDNDDDDEESYKSEGYGEEDELDNLKGEGISHAISGGSRTFLDGDESSSTRCAEEDENDAVGGEADAGAEEGGNDHGMIRRLVAMVEVPPEQVPEGVLNLVRSHRPFIQHVRVVITSDDDDDDDDDDTDDKMGKGGGGGRSQAYPKDGLATGMVKDTVAATGPGPPPPAYSSPPSPPPKLPSTPKAASASGTHVESVAGKLPQSPPETTPKTLNLMLGSESSCPPYRAAATNPNRPLHTYNRSPSLSASPVGAAMEDAASILAADEEAEAAKVAAVESLIYSRGRRIKREGMKRLGLHLEDEKWDDDGDDAEEEKEKEQEEKSMTYLVLFLLSSHSAAEEFVYRLDGRPYTSLEEDVVCALRRVVSIEGDGGVSLVSPFFAPASPTYEDGVGGATDTATDNETTLVSSALPKATTAATATVATTAAAAGGGAMGSAEAHNCAVCLESLDVVPTRWGGIEIAPSSSSASSPSAAAVGVGGGLNSVGSFAAASLSSSSSSNGIITTVCNHTFHIDCLLQWQDSPCPVCRYDHSGLNEALSQCHVCGTTENNYVCLICGIVSCGGGGGGGGGTGNAFGRSNGAASMMATADGNGEYHHHRHQHDDEDTDCHAGRFHRSANHGGFGAARSARSPPSGSGSGGSSSSIAITRGHAREHYDETLHAYALDTSTQHVWDFAGQGYVHRLIQNQDDGKIVEVSDPSNATGLGRSQSPGLTDAQEGEVVHRKLEGFASQYYTLLKSQLEQQRIYYEGRLEEIRRDHRMRQGGGGGRGDGTGRGCGTTADHIAALRQEKNQLEARCATLRRKHRKVSDEVSFLRDMNESLESNKEPIRMKIDDAQRRRAEMKKMMMACLPPLEEKVQMLMMQLEESSSMGLGAGAEARRDRNKKPAARPR